MDSNVHDEPRFEKEKYIAMNIYGWGHGLSEKEAVRNMRTASGTNTDPSRVWHLTRISGSGDIRARVAQDGYITIVPESDQKNITVRHIR